MAAHRLPATVGRKHGLGPRRRGDRIGAADISHSWFCSLTRPGGTPHRRAMAHLSRGRAPGRRPRRSAAAPAHHGVRGSRAVRGVGVHPGRVHPRSAQPALALRGRCHHRCARGIFPRRLSLISSGACDPQRAAGRECQTDPRRRCGKSRRSFAHRRPHPERRSVGSAPGQRWELPYLCAPGEPASHRPTSSASDRVWTASSRQRTRDSPSYSANRHCAASWRSTHWEISGRESWMGWR